MLSAVETDGGLFGVQGAVGLDPEADVCAVLLHVVHVEREPDGEPLVDEPVAKGRAEDVEKTRHGFFMS